MERSPTAFGLPFGMMKPRDKMMFGPYMTEENGHYCSQNLNPVQSLQSGKQNVQQSALHLKPMLQSRNIAAFPNTRALNFLTNDNFQSPGANNLQNVQNMQADLPCTEASNAILLTDWRQSVSPQVRQNSVKNIIKILFPAVDIATCRDNRMRALITYAEKIEHAIFKYANNIADYFRLLLEKNDEIQKEYKKLLQKRKREKNKNKLLEQEVRPSVEHILNNNFSTASLESSILGTVSQFRSPNPSNCDNHLRIPPPNVTVPTNVGVRVSEPYSRFQLFNSLNTHLNITLNQDELNQLQERRRSSSSVNLQQQKQHFNNLNYVTAITVSSADQSNIATTLSKVSQISSSVHKSLPPVASPFLQQNLLQMTNLPLKQKQLPITNSSLAQNDFEINCLKQNHQLTHPRSLYAFETRHILPQHKQQTSILLGQGQLMMQQNNINKSRIYLLNQSQKQNHIQSVPQIQSHLNQITPTYEAEVSSQISSQFQENQLLHSSATQQQGGLMFQQLSKPGSVPGLHSQISSNLQSQLSQGETKVLEDNASFISLQPILEVEKNIKLQPSVPQELEKELLVNSTSSTALVSPSLETGSMQTGTKKICYDSMRCVAYNYEKKIGMDCNTRVDDKSGCMEKGKRSIEMKEFKKSMNSTEGATISFGKKPIPVKKGLINVKHDSVIDKQELASPQISSKPLKSSVVKTELGSESSQPISKLNPMAEIFKPDELRCTLMRTFENLYMQDPESLPFRQPVDPQSLGITDYFDIIKKPIDLSTIKQKLDIGEYQDPWQYIDDVNLMFNNAQLYNKKTSRVYKHCKKLAVVFEQDIDSVMLSLGYCCGKKYVFEPQILYCYGKQLCFIPRYSKYWSDKNLFQFCEKCFINISGDEVTLVVDPSQSPLVIKKNKFVEMKNNHLDTETFVRCNECGRKLHQICVLYLEFIWPEGYTCDNCLKSKGQKRKENKFTANRLPQTKLGQCIENHVNSFLKESGFKKDNVIVRVVSSLKKYSEVKPEMKARFVDSGEFPKCFPYTAKAIFVFKEIDGFDICLFGMHVQEYDSSCAAPNARCVYISYLDSVNFFQPKHLRTPVYHEILLSYLDFVKHLGYTMAYIWACPPNQGDDYIFHCHPPDQRIPKLKRLQDWYEKMLEKGIKDGVVSSYKNVFHLVTENNLASAAELPYFDGDFWPNILEESIKQQEDEKKQKAAAQVIGTTSVNENEVSVNGKKRLKNGGNKKTKKSKSYYSNADSDLMAKIISVIKKHKEVFFRIQLQSMREALSPIVDPDPLIVCELMDGRDTFLAMAREKHYEFSSLRRTKFSTMALLYQLHNHGQDLSLYSCNNCKTNAEARYHCTVCDDFDLCVKCFNKEGHHHKMQKLGFELIDESSTIRLKPVNSQESRRLAVQSVCKSLVNIAG
ncbi:CREB-binding protein [Nephila pilipes]|uniref:histone acetyltransferase n=1 Tax=Nephila pilipes TaxID=299642 RepID=A0A8X6NS82_NEPPI|nr:CREB-binding protein [Nephila pilipes]